jgi:uncharacterized protein (DUF952 family)
MSRVSLALVVTVFVTCACAVAICVSASETATTATTMPLPFTRVLYLVEPPLPYLNGSDVTILQSLLTRSSYVPLCSLAQNGEFDGSTESAVTTFQQAAGLPPTGRFDERTATLLLKQASCDGFHDVTGQPAKDYGDQFQYKIVVPVHANRTIESTASLFDRDNQLLLQFTVRAHGHDLYGPSPWPTFNNTDPGRNEFSPDGNTPTGLSLIDLNSPENVPKLYGPYPINRVVAGLYGNSALLLPHIRSGILLHTGEWPNWTPPQPMPNSAGCMHAYPNAIKTIWDTLVANNVTVRKNPFGEQPYPYKPQGVVLVEQIEQCDNVGNMTALLIVHEKEWEKAKQQGYYSGNAEDKHDGFIHMCTRSTVYGVVAKHFANQTDVYAVVYNLSEIANRSKFEIAGDGLAYPHYYGNLTVLPPAVVDIVKLPTITVAAAAAEPME